MKNSKTTEQPQANTQRKLVEPLEVQHIIAHIPLTQIEVGDQNLREVVDDEGIIELAADIAKRGLLQAIGVRQIKADRFQLLWGLRRLTAVHRLGLGSIIARVYTGPRDAVKAIALAENLHRQEMSLAEECHAVAHLHTEEQLSPDQIASACGKGRNWVLQRLMVPGLPVEVREALLDGSLSLGSAEAIARLPEACDRAQVVSQALAQKLSVSQVKAFVDMVLATPSMHAAIEAGVAAAQSPPEAPVLMSPCAACGRPRKLVELVIIRVCNDGCIIGEGPHEGAPSAH